MKELSKERIKKRIVKLPSLIEFYGWVFFFPGFFTGFIYFLTFKNLNKILGPFIDFNDYILFNNREIFKDVKKNHKYIFFL